MLCGVGKLGESMKQRSGKEIGRLMVPALLVHGVCCGGLLVALLMGSAGLTVVAALVRDPLIQAAGLLAGTGLALWAWRRHKASLARRGERTLPRSAHEGAESDKGWQP